MFMQNQNVLREIEEMAIHGTTPGDRAAAVKLLAKYYQSKDNGSPKDNIRLTPKSKRKKAPWTRRQSRQQSIKDLWKQEDISWSQYDEIAGRQCQDASGTPTELMQFCVFWIVVVTAIYFIVRYILPIIFT